MSKKIMKSLYYFALGGLPVHAIFLIWDKSQFSLNMFLTEGVILIFFTLFTDIDDLTK